MGKVGKEGEAWVRTVMFSRDPTKLASGSGDKTVRVWDVAIDRPNTRWKAIHVRSTQ